MLRGVSAQPVTDASKARSERAPGVVPLGGMAFSCDPGAILATPWLGSAVAVAVLHRAAGVGGLLHFLAPEAGAERQRRAEQPELFADTGIEMLLHHIERGARAPGQLEAWIVGGADPLRRGAGAEVLLGQRNAEAARRHLAKAGVRVVSESTGGWRARRATLEIGIGIVRVTETPASRRAGEGEG